MTTNHWFFLIIKDDNVTLNLVILFFVLFLVCSMERSGRWSAIRLFFDWALLSVTSYLVWEFTRL